MTEPHAPRSRRRLLAALAAAALAPLPAMAGDAAHPTVVELFTSQGCASCVPANANLITLSRQPDVLALSFGVTYWDQLGWKDTFARPEYTQRQQVYETALGRPSLVTPQVVIDGRADVLGGDITAVRKAVARIRRAPGPAVSIGPQEVSVGASAPPTGDADVWLVRYDPNTVQVPVKRGENGGKTMPHKNAVHELIRLGGWNGKAGAYRLPPARTAGLSTAVLVQAAHGGPILAAARG